MEEAAVSVATGAMSSVLAKLGELLHEKYKLAKGVRKDIMFLRSELRVMNDLLYDMADVEDLSALNKGWRDRVRDLAYDVEDCIDLSTTRLDRAGGDCSKGGLFSYLPRWLKTTRESFKIAGKIRDLRARVVEESKQQKRYKLDGLGSNSGEASNNKIDLRMCALWVETEKLVGVDKPRDELISWLMPVGGEPLQQVRTLSIVGGPGLGKTTLANEVYKKIQGHFECKAFISVSQKPHMKDVLMKICSQVGVTASLADDEIMLVSKLRERLLCKRYIVVVDDIWDSDPWKLIGQALVQTSHGSIIIITTRLNDVAESCHYSHGGRVYDMKPLGDKDSRRLFFKRIFDSEERCPHELERASEDILKKCDGIPLAIISISSFLAEDVPQSPDHWNKVKESISSPLPENKSVETMNSVLSLSYYNLPHHLRTCLLYLSAFPEDYLIERDRLISRWIAEGFVNAKPGDSLCETGLRYFNVLINRSLIQPRYEVTGEVWSCRVHDVILNFLVSKSIEDNFLTLFDPYGLPPSIHSNKVRRLSIQNSYSENIVSWINSIKPHVRSLTCFVDCEELHPLAEFEAVRVLDLKDCESLENIHIANIEMLLQLRYLNIGETRVSELPAGIGQVQHLQTLDIDSSFVKELPSTIVLLEKLVCLSVGPDVKFPAEGFSKMKGLEQLIGLGVYGQPLSFLKELGQLTNLRILDASWNQCSGTGVANCEGSEWDIFTSSLCVLGSHKLHSLYFHGSGQTNAVIPHDSFPAVHSLQIFFIFKCFSGLPIWMGSLVNLEMLFLGTEQFTPENLGVLGGMPALESLILYVNTCASLFTIGGHKFQRLKIFRVDCIKQLQFMPGSMPNLKHLNVGVSFTKNSCSVLGIQHLTSLNKVEVRIYDAKSEDRGGVEVLTAKIRSELDAHPNRPTLSLYIQRYSKNDKAGASPCQGS